MFEKERAECNVRVLWILLACVVGVAIWGATEFPPVAHTLPGSLLVSTLGLLFGACVLRAFGSKKAPSVPKLRPRNERAVREPFNAGDLAFALFVLTIAAAVFTLVDLLVVGIATGWWEVVPQSSLFGANLLGWLLIVPGSMFVGVLIFFATFTFSRLRAGVFVAAYFAIAIVLFSAQLMGWV